MTKPISATLFLIAGGAIGSGLGEFMEIIMSLLEVVR